MNTLISSATTDYALGSGLKLRREQESVHSILKKSEDYHGD